MNKILTIVLSCFFFLPQLHADDGNKEKVYSIIKVRKTVPWYTEQSALWYQTIQQNPKDADAWLNYYTAQRMLKIVGAGVEQKDLNNLVEKCEKAIENTFEYHYIAYWNSGLYGSEKNVEHLKKAQELGPNRIELFDDLFTHYEINRDQENLAEVCKKWFDSNDISAGIYAWNYNMLESTEKDAILITSGDNDTYPAIVLQNAKNIRKDVNVLNNSLLGISSYRNAYFKELGLPTFDKKLEEYGSWEAFQKDIIEHLKKHSDRPIYFAISAQKYLYESFENEVYNVGMAYKWSKTKFDNIAVIKKNYEKKYLLDYLKIDLSNDISASVVDFSNSNYLVSMLTLYNHYEESEDEKAKDIKTLIDGIAAKNKMEDQVDAVLNSSKTHAKSLVINEPKLIEKELVKINDSMYAGKTEISNAMYELFLTDLLKQRRFADLEKAKNEAVDWMSLLSDKDKTLSYDEVFKNGKPNEDNFPVVNISYEAAQLYCEWLTLVYNNLEHKKKKFNRVEFRLPTEQEWEYIARGDKKDATYSWGGPFVRNSKGCYLANINTSKDKIPANAEGGECFATSSDGGLFPVVVESYFPNSFGLYNITGNVSEMVQEQGVSKGGSWNTYPGEATIQKSEKYTKPNAETGFRIIMIVK